MKKILSSVTFKNKQVHTNKPILKDGKAPDFSLIDKNLNPRSLADFSGKKLLSVNPSFDTSVCANTAKHFNELAKANPNVHFLMISKDLPFAQKRFCELEKLENVTALSIMRSDEFAKDYGVLMTDGPLQGLTARAIFLIDEDNRIVYSELVPEVTNEPDYKCLEKHLTK